MEGFEPGSLTKIREFISRLIPKLKEAVRDDETERLEGLLKALQIAVGEKEGQGGRTKDELLEELWSELKKMEAKTVCSPTGGRSGEEGKTD